MTAYLLARLHLPTETHPDLLEYQRRIEAALAPFSGRFLVRAGAIESLEGDWRGDVVLIEFPSLDHARGFYGSPAYRQIIPLRVRHVTGDLILVRGVAPAPGATAVPAVPAGPQGTG
ncbi:DUF1330 domain-containing protein [Bailinhaonella thermotolerans]|uniref:DUF1330 domain-containing protein n=1 Tax=Bailinhaonella thermotolerans TaxID=1070861 RepID=A0A3A4B674_9ACTN|nr:DUF1330 domain-containing protein [Bailinhaonella thermotolerans]RJL27062.1 DUF1330 domain-containing protein [Bailinhaonella thermotolerans]